MPTSLCRSIECGPIAFHAVQAPEQVSERADVLPNFLSTNNRSDIDRHAVNRLVTCKSILRVAWDTDFVSNSQHIFDRPNFPKPVCRHFWAPNTSSAECPQA